MHRVRNQQKIVALAALALLGACRSPQPVNVKHVSLGIFEVVDCKTSGTTPMSVKGETEKYCLAAKPIVDETDVKFAEATRDDSGKVKLNLYVTLKAGERMKETTGRIVQEHVKSNDRGKLGMVIDGKLVSVAALATVISDAIVIEGTFGWDEANEIAHSLTHQPQQ